MLSEEGSLAHSVDRVAASRKVLEVGIFGGKSLIPIALAVQSAGGGTVIGVEPWSADVAISEPTDENNDAWWASVDFAQVKERFFANSARYGVLPMIKVMEMDSDSAFRFLEPGGRQFDLIHIDGAHSPERALRDAKSWSKLVKKGGLVVFDDIAWPSVMPARDFLTQNLTVIEEVFESDGVSYGAYEAPPLTTSELTLPSSESSARQQALCAVATERIQTRFTWGKSGRLPTARGRSSGWRASPAGRQIRQCGRMEAAAGAAGELADICVGDAEPQRLASGYLVHIGQPARAAAYARRAIDLDPGNAEYALHYGIVLNLSATI